MRVLCSGVVLIGFFLVVTASASVLTFGDVDCLNIGCYNASNPEFGATLEGLSDGVVTMSAHSFGHGYPFTPDAGDFPGTDQIYVGSVQTGAHDGYSVSPRINGPQVLVMDYSSLVPAGQSVTSLTLGIAGDDFQFPAFGQPFIATLNGSPATVLTNTLNSVDDTGPQVHFFTVGLNTALDNPSHVLTLSIDEGGDGGDGWAVDFLTVGITTTGTAANPEPRPFALLLLPLCAVLLRAGGFRSARILQ